MHLLESSSQKKLRLCVVFFEFLAGVCGLMVNFKFHTSFELKKFLTARPSLGGRQSTYLCFENETMFCFEGINVAVLRLVSSLVSCVCDAVQPENCAVREACRADAQQSLTQRQAAGRLRQSRCTVRLDSTSTVEGALRGSFLAASGAVAA